MGPPARLYHIEWSEPYRDRPQERRFKTAHRAARQLAAILAAPDDVAVLRGVWVSNGPVEWEPVDPDTLIAEVADAFDDDSDDLDPGQRREALAAAWAYHEGA